MTKKNTIIILSFSLLFLSGCSDNSPKKITYTEDKEVVEVCPVPMEKTKIVACPTFYEYLDKIDEEKYEVIYSGSTSESINLLNRGLADIALSGRTPLPGESGFKYETVEDKEKRYSFISSSSLTIYKDEFSSYNFYTDLELKDVESDLRISNAEKVENVYNYLNKGIVITSWENTDFTRSSIVQVLNNDNSRLKISRIPTIYYQSNCEEYIINEIKELIINK